MIHKRNGGFARAATIVVILVILILLAVLGYWAYNRKNTDDTNGLSQTATSYNATSTGTLTTLIYTPTTTQPTKTVVAAKPAPTYTAPRNNTSVAAAYYPTTSYGNSYHNSTFGLTLPMPAGFSASQTAESVQIYAGVSDSRTITFYQNGAPAFSINVFSKEQWNNIRIQETLGQINTFGEGVYLGENFDWIFSYNVYQNTANESYILNSARFY